MTKTFIFSQDSLWDFLIRFGINIVVLFIIIRLIYYTYNRKEEYLFSFFMMGIMVFTICSLLYTVEIQVGLALGLFAIFALLRFRTINLSFKTMAYLFVVVGVSVINALFNPGDPIIGPVVVHSLIIASVLVLELYFQKTSLNKYTVILNKLELLDPDKREELRNDISGRVSRKILKVEIRKIDLKKGNAELEVFFKGKAIEWSEEY